MSTWASVPVLATGDILTAAAWNTVADNMADSGWISLASLTFANSWLAASGVTPGFRVIGNAVEFRGGVYGGVSGDGCTTNGIPSDIRPTADRFFPATDMAGDLISCAVEIQSNGAIVPITGTPADGVSLEGVRYWSD